MSKKEKHCTVYQYHYKSISTWTWGAMDDAGLIPDGCMPPPIKIVWNPIATRTDIDQGNYRWAALVYNYTANPSERMGMFTDYRVEVYHHEAMRYFNDVFEGRVPYVARNVMTVDHFVHEYLHYVEHYTRYMKFNSNRPEYSIPFELGYDLWFDMVNVDKPKRVLEHREYKVERTNETKTMRAMNMLFGLNPDLIVKFDGRFAKKKAEQTAEPRKSLVALATLEFLWSNYQSLYTVTNDPIEWMMRRKRCIEFIKSQADDSLYEYYD